MFKVTMEFTDPSQAARMVEALSGPTRAARRRMLDADSTEETDRAFADYHALRRVATAIYTAIHNPNGQTANDLRGDSPTLRERRRFL